MGFCCVVKIGIFMALQISIIFIEVFTIEENSNILLLNFSCKSQTRRVEFREVIFFKIIQKRIQGF